MAAVIEGEEVKQQLRQAQEQIKDAEKQIKDVDEQMKDVGEQLKNTTDEVVATRLTKKEDQLRDGWNQMLDRLNELQDKEMFLLKSGHVSEPELVNRVEQTLVKNLNELRSEVRAEVRSDLLSEVRSEVRSDLLSEVRPEVRADLLLEVRAAMLSTSSSMGSISYTDKGLVIQKCTDRLDLPAPLVGEEAERMWPAEHWNNRDPTQSPEAQFKILLDHLRCSDDTPWTMKFTGASRSVCGGSDLKPDVVIFKNPGVRGAPPVGLTTGAILVLHSRNTGKYNNPQDLGKALLYGEKMLEALRGYRSYVIVGVTDLKSVQWFKVIWTSDRYKFRYEVHPELNDVRGSLCGLLKSRLSDLGVVLPDLCVSGAEYKYDRFLGSGATSNVLCVKDEDGIEYAAKVPFTGKNLENDQHMLTVLHHVKGVPKVVGWFDDEKSLIIQPVGSRLSHESWSRWFLWCQGSWMFFKMRMLKASSTVMCGQTTS